MFTSFVDWNEHLDCSHGAIITKFSINVEKTRWRHEKSHVLSCFRSLPVASCGCVGSREQIQRSTPCFVRGTCLATVVFFRFEVFSPPLAELRLEWQRRLTPKVGAVVQTRNGGDLIQRSGSLIEYREDGLSTLLKVPRID